MTKPTVCDTTCGPKTVTYIAILAMLASACSNHAASPGAGTPDANASGGTPTSGGTDTAEASGSAGQGGTDGGNAAGGASGGEADAGANGADGGSQTSGITITVSPRLASVAPGGTQAFTCTVTGAANAACNWSVAPGGGSGTVDSSGVYTAPSGTGTDRVVATAQADPNKTATAVVSVVKPAGLQVLITPNIASVSPSQGLLLGCSVVGTTNTMCDLSVLEGSAGGTTNGFDYYSAPATPGEYHVVAKSRQDPTKTAVATISVGAVAVSITRAYGIVSPGQTQGFQCVVNGTTDNTCKWTVQEGSSGGTITSTTAQGMSAGLYTAPSTPGYYHVTATSNADPTKATSATILVRNIAPGACAATAPVGQWEEITPPDIPLPGPIVGHGATVCDYTGQTLRLDPFLPNIVYAGTCQYGVYRSTDCGSTWKHVNTGTQGKVLDDGRQWTFVIDPDPSAKMPDGSAATMYTNAGYTGMGPMGLYRSDNAGVDWAIVWPPPDGSYPDLVDGNFVAQVAMDPTDHRHLLLGFHSDCNRVKGTYGTAGQGPYTLSDGVTKVTALCYTESFDRGEHWVVHNSDPQMGVSESQTPYILSGKDWLFAIHDRNSRTWFTTNSGTSWTKIGDNMAGHWPGQLYHASTGDWYLGSDSGPIRSTNGGASWAFVPNVGFSLTVALSGDGTRMWATDNGALTPWVSPLVGANLIAGRGVYRTALETNGTSWSSVEGWDYSKIPFSGFTQGAQMLAIDRDRHIIYAPHGTQGFYRIKYQ